MAYERRSSATPNDAAKMLQGIRRPRGARPSRCFLQFRPLFRQLSEPVQSDRGLSVIHFVTAIESPDSHSIEPGSLDRTGDGVLLLDRCDAIIMTGADVNWRIKKIRTRLDSRVSITQVVFVGAGDVDAGETTSVPREQRRNVTNTLSSSGKPCAR